MKTKSVSDTIFPWLRANLGPHCLGCLTGYSGRAVRAAVQLIDAYSSSDSSSGEALLQAFKLVVDTLDRPERELAYHAIAHVLNWEDRALIWMRAGLELDFEPSRCKFE